jgi:voltage-gated potassium channel
VARPDVLKRLFRSLLGGEPTVVRAGATIAASTMTIAIAAGFLMRLADQESFPNIWRGLWWAIQTVTTVGYGDVVPRTVAGRIIASLVMLAGIGFISVLTATVAAAFIESARRRLEADRSDSTDAKLEELRAQIAALEAAVRSRSEGSS